MQYREITPQVAKSIFMVLKDECGYRGNIYDESAFISAISGPDSCYEWRFIGALGFGGKFRNSGNLDNTPYVDCYREDETPERLAMIEKANERIAALFDKGTP